MRYKINKCSYTDKKKDGTPILSKFNKPAWRVGLQVSEYGDIWINGFLPFAPDRWENTEQEIEIYDEEYQGVKQKKFRLPSKEDKIGKQLEEINGRVLKTMLMVEELGRKLIIPPKDDYPDEVADPKAIDEAFEAVSSKGEDDIFPDERRKN